MQNVMRGLCGVLIARGDVGRWLSVTANGMISPLPSRLIQSADRSLGASGSVGDHM